MPETFTRTRPLKEPVSLAGIEPLFFTRDQLAKAVAVSPRTIDIWRQKGLIPFIKVQGVVRFNIAKVKAVLEGRFEACEVHTPKRRPRKTQAQEPAGAATNI
jgi:hypothetical protein